MQKKNNKAKENIKSLDGEVVQGRGEIKKLGQNDKAMNKEDQPVKKKRSGKYDKRLKLNGSFEDIMKLAMKSADKKLEEKKK